MASSSARASDAAYTLSAFDLMVDSVYRNGGRSCINCSGIYASRHTREIAAALAERLGPIEVLPPDDPNAGLAAFTIEGAAASIWKALQRDIDDPQTTHCTEKYGARLVERLAGELFQRAPDTA